MTYNDIIKKLESIGIEIDYSVIEVSDLNSLCNDTNAFEKLLHPAQ